MEKKLTVASGDVNKLALTIEKDLLKLKGIWAHPPEMFIKYLIRHGMKEEEIKEQIVSACLVRG